MQTVRIIAAPAYTAPGYVRSIGYDPFIDDADFSVGESGGEFYVYKGEKLIRVCPSIGMAREVAAGA